MEQRPRFDFTLKMCEEHPEPFGIHPSVVVPPWVYIGERVRIHRGVTLGSQGFGFGWNENNEYLHIPHVGKVIIGDDVEIFEGTNVSRGTIGSTLIGNGTKIDTLCHIAHNVEIGKNCFITSGVIFSGSARINDGVYIGINSSIRDHIRIADNVFVGQGSNVVRDITEENSVWAGNPARFVRWRRGNER